MTSFTGITFRNDIFGGAEAGATEASTYPDSATFVAAPPLDGLCNLAIFSSLFVVVVVVVVVVDWFLMCIYIRIII